MGSVLKRNSLPLDFFKVTVNVAGDDESFNNFEEIEVNRGDDP